MAESDAAMPWEILDAVTARVEEGVPFREAATLIGVSKTRLARHVHSQIRHRGPGRPTVLTASEEKKIFELLSSFSNVWCGSYEN